jgi:hypothetical protein
MDLREWIAGELDEHTSRVTEQVLARVPPERRLEQPGGGNSITWAVWHSAMHADLALRGVLRGDEPLHTAWAARAGAAGLPPGCGLEENEHPDISALDQEAVAGYLAAVLGDAATWVGSADLDGLGGTPDARSVLHGAGVPEDDYGWLYRLWEGKPAAFFLRWEVVGHVGNHVGEMIATRNRMGLSPF